jgi:DHA1 family bicyclomycin/chloramphenicol resistance-like MFS transporter
MVAPTVGSYFTIAFGWESVFIALAVIALMLMAMVFSVLPQGRVADKTISLKPKSVLRNFYTVVRQPQFLTYCLAGGLASSAPFAFIAGSSDVFINIFKMDEREFGWIFAIVGGVIIGCTQLNHLLLRRYKSEQVVLGALIYQLVVGTILVLGAWYSLFNSPTIIVLCILFLAAHGLSNANTNALSLAPFSRNTGSAASILGTFRMASGAIVSALVAVFHNQTEMPMIMMMVAPVCIGFIVLLTRKTIARLRPDEEEREGVIV